MRVTAEAMHCKRPRHFCHSRKNVPGASLVGVLEMTKIANGVIGPADGEQETLVELEEVVVTGVRPWWVTSVVLYLGVLVVLVGVARRHG
jgi:hypothetical protein